MPNGAAIVNLAAVPGSGGVVWSWSPRGLHTNLVTLTRGQSIEPHRNDELDVLIVVLDGEVDVHVDATVHQLGGLEALVIPRGATRSIAPRSGEVRYLSVHRERQGLTIGATRHGGV